MAALAALVAAAAVYGQPAMGQDGPAVTVRKDADGVPLPDGAIARLGSSRFRFDGYPYSPPVFSADGKLVAVGGNGAAFVFDAVTGRLHLRVPLPEGHHPRVVRFLADGKRLAIGCGDWRQAAQLTIHDLADGKSVTTSKFSGRSQIFVIDVTADGSQVLVEDRFVKAYLWDVSAHREVWAFDHPAASNTLPFTADGKRLVLASSRQAELRDAETGHVVGTFPSPGPGYGGHYRATLAPDGRIALAADPQRAVAVLAADGKDRVRIYSSDWGVERLYFSADSRYLVAPTEYGTQVWDLTAGEGKGPVARLPGGHAVGFAADGKTLALADNGCLTLWTVGDWKRLPKSADPASPVRQVRFTPDGKTVLGYTRDGWVKWTAAGGPASRVSEEPAAYYNPLVDVSADGRFALDALWEPGKGAGKGTDEDKYVLRVIDLATGKDRRIPVHGIPWDPIQISPDGGYVTALVEGSEFVVWDARAGAVLHRQKWPQESFLYGATPAPDGKGLARSVVAVSAPGVRGPVVGSASRYRSVTVTDHLTGHRWDPIPMPASIYVGGGRFSRDGTRLVLLGRFPNRRGDSVTVWDARTGRRLMDRDWAAGPVAAAADHRSLLVGDSNGNLALVEVATGGDRAAFRHGGRVLSAAFSADGTRAVSSSPEAPVYVWDLFGNPGQWDAARADAVWADLQSPDAKVAFAAVRKLRTNPAEAIPFLRDRVKLPAAPTEESVAALLKRLDGPRFADREKAQKELADVAELVCPRLEAARKIASEEAGRRLDQVLKATEGLTPERLRHVRACEVLEGIGTPDAVRVLRGWAGGPDGARLTREAKESLARLGRE